MLFILKYLVLYLNTFQKYWFQHCQLVDLRWRLNPVPSLATATISVHRSPTANAVKTHLRVYHLLRVLWQRLCWGLCSSPPASSVSLKCCSTTESTTKYLQPSEINFTGFSQNAFMYMLCNIWVIDRKNTALLYSLNK